MATPRRAYVETYGCQMNISDGELMQGILESGGYEIADSPEEADVILVNTCAIRDHAERRVLGRVAQLKGLKDDHPGLILGVTGCMAQRMGDDLAARAPYVDLVMGPDGYRSLPDVLGRLAGADGTKRRQGIEVGAATPAPSSDKRRTQLTVLDLDMGENYEGLEQRRSSDVSAWVPIQRGCNHRCTYCIVPYVRGDEKNRKPTEILSEIATIAGRGITEVTLLGQTVNSYRYDDWSFAELLRATARVPGIRRVRYTSPHPNDMTDELIEVMATEPEVCEHLHLPVQAGNDRTLKRMLRRYTVDSFLDVVDRVRAAIPDIALTTDVIVAFPGETDEEFEDTLALMREVRFDDAFTYRYSPRDGTPATRMPEEWFIPDDEAQARLERLIEVSRAIQGEINAAEVGRDERLLIEKLGRDDGYVLGRTRGAKAVVVPGSEAEIGSYLDVRLTRTTGATFVGERIATDRGHPAAVGAESAPRTSVSA
ncbi:MAG TPA: tRNA (N6-isopentenyl adenosine(37)-C2)-methylthiotransferase MiaB [Longimicrobiales bacterium]|nr:tRNA (N6-isopentenyl adenosine(37)-C2)-methylthiotransferase MiaB [Longimicrobiales bacterium]